VLLSIEDNDFISHANICKRDMLQTLFGGNKGIRWVVMFLLKKTNKKTTTALCIILLEPRTLPLHTSSESCFPQEEP